MVKVEPHDISVSSPVTLLNCGSMDGTSTADAEDEAEDDMISDGDADDEDMEEVEDEDMSMHPGLLCRLCANPVSDAVFIFGESGKDKELAAKINICLPVTVSLFFLLTVFLLYNTVIF